MAGNQTLNELINDLALENNENPIYVAPVIGVLALGQNNRFAYSLEQETSSTSLGLNAFFKGKPEPLPLARVSLSDGWSWQVDGRQREGEVAKILYASSSVSLGPAPCASQLDNNKSETQSAASGIPHAYRNKLIVCTSARRNEVIEGDQHCYASAEIHTNNTSWPATLSFAYSALRPGAYFKNSAPANARTASTWTQTLADTRKLNRCDLNSAEPKIQIPTGRYRLMAGSYNAAWKRAGWKSSLCHSEVGIFVS